MTVTTTFSGTFTATIGGEPKFVANELQMTRFIDGVTHIAGSFREDPLSRDYRLIYFIMQPDVTNGKYVFPEGVSTMLYARRVDGIEVMKADIVKGTFNIEASDPNTNYRMDFNAELLDRSGQPVFITGSFDVTKG